MHLSRSLAKVTSTVPKSSKKISITLARSGLQSTHIKFKTFLPLYPCGLRPGTPQLFKPNIESGYQYRLLSQSINCKDRPSDKELDGVEPPYAVEDLPYGEQRPIRVIVIGAGVSGIDIMRTLQKHNKNVIGIIYEKNAEVGGTWHENRYPGCASDDPSHSYQYTHSPNPRWTSVFAPAREIEAYLNDVVDNNAIRGNIMCNHIVKKAEWIEEKGQWAVNVRDVSSGKQFVDSAEVLIDATGIFNDWKWPEVEGLHDFKGELIHTAHWPDKFEYGDKRIAVLGNGASGVQIVPAIQPHVKELFHLIRSKTWIAPPSAAVKLCQEYTMGDSRHFSKESIETFVANPNKYAEFRAKIDGLAAKDRFKTIVNAKESEDARTRITSYMTKILKSKPHLIPMLIPTFSVGCRRITASFSYLESLTEANVTVSNIPIKRCTPDGIEFKDGKVINVDAIICATGFNTSFIPRFPLIGENRENLQDVWRNDYPKAYQGIMVTGMPNYYRFIGPNSCLAHGAIPQLSSHICKYVLRHIQKLQIERITSIRPLPAAVDDFNEHIETFLPKTAWAGKSCGGWYKSKGVDAKEGRVTAVHPGSQDHWEQMLDNVRWEDFEFRRSRENRFSYLGNGFTAKELEVNDGT